MSELTSPLNLRSSLAQFEQNDPREVLLRKGRIALHYDSRARALIAKVRV